MARGVKYKDQEKHDAKTEKRYSLTSSAEQTSENSDEKCDSHDDHCDEQEPRHCGTRVCVRGAYYQSESHSAYRNESGAKSNKCGVAPTVDASLFAADRKPPPHESSCHEGNHEQETHSIDPQSP
jgi:hypothetical protein